jgi:hypothetical protein
MVAAHWKFVLSIVVVGNVISPVTTAEWLRGFS